MLERRRVRTLSCLLLSVLIAACARTRTVGESDGKGTNDPAPPVKAKLPTTISAGEHELIGGNSPILGDVDGDGLDDFIVVMLQLGDPLQEAPTMHAYLFYGRSDFPEQLSTADADATFRADGDATPLGDVNGDGFADFGLQYATGFEIVTGRSKRFEGLHDKRSTGRVWEAEQLPPPFAQGIVGTLELVQPAGDVNCDGRADLVVWARRLAAENEPEPAGAFGLVESSFLVLGATELPSGVWDPRWAAASFGAPDASHEEFGWTGRVMPSAVGDLDADGCSDLAAFYMMRTVVYFGHEGEWTGAVTPTGQLPFTDVGFTAIGDLDGDGADDLAFSNTQQRLGVVYGAKDRWPADALPTLTIMLDQPNQLQFEFSFGAGDIDGDGSAELVIGSSMYGLESGVEPVSARGAMYAFRGTGKRSVGSYALGDSDLLLLGPAHDPSAGPVDPEGDAGGSGVGSTLSIGGDVDGDGARDILTGAPSAGTRGAVFLIPSGPRPPS